MIETLRRLIPDFSHLEEFEIRDGLEIAGYQTTLILHSGYPFAGGTHAEKSVARRICAAEAIERAHVKSERENAARGADPFLLKEIPTSCGFAAGFEGRSTVFRAICEAAERWYWSKWIDEGFAPDRHLGTPKDKLNTVFLQAFDRVHWFKASIILSNENIPAFMPTDLVFTAAIGSNKKGIFPGSRVSTSDDDLFTHPLLEAWRHLAIYNGELREKQGEDIIDQRIKYFGDNGNATLSTLLSESARNPGLCRLRLLRQVANTDGYEVWRSLADDYVPWHLGDEKRFVY